MTNLINYSYLPPEDLEHVYIRTAQLWENAKGKRFFITGGTGFFGIWLLETFGWINDSLNLGMQISVLTRDPMGFRERKPHLANRKDIELIEGDIQNFSFPGGKFDYLIHAATDVSLMWRPKSARLLLDSMVGGTKNILEFAKFADVETLLFTSSGAVYGAQPPEMLEIPEDFGGAPNPLKQGSTYGIGKRVSEHLCILHGEEYGVDVKIARCFAFIGPHLPLDGNYAIGNFLRDIVSNRPIRINGDGTPWRSYLYSADLATWLWVILFQGRSKVAYNVGSDEGYSLKDVAEIVSCCAKATLPPVCALEPIAGAPVQRYIPSIKRAREELGLIVNFDLADSIERTLKWLRAKYN